MKREEKSDTKLNAIIKELDARLDHTKRQRPGLRGHLDQAEHILCQSGLKMSVQASEFHYCTPRVSVGPWSAVEVGFPNMKVEALLQYAEDADKPTDTVYAWVPKEVVAQVILDNGGFAS